MSRRCYIYVPIEDVVDATAFFADLGGITFSIELYPLSGGDTATHIGTCPDPSVAATNALSTFKSAFPGSNYNLMDPFSYGPMAAWVESEGFSTWPVSP